MTWWKQLIQTTWFILCSRESECSDDWWDKSALRVVKQSDYIYSECPLITILACSWISFSNLCVSCVVCCVAPFQFECLFCITKGGHNSGFINIWYPVAVRMVQPTVSNKVPLCLSNGFSFFPWKFSSFILVTY